MTNRYNPQHGANMVDRYIGSAFDIVYAVYKELNKLPVIYDFAIEFIPKMEQILDENTEIFGKLTEIDQAVITSTEAASSAESSANTATIRLNSIEQLHGETVINRDESFQYRNESFQYKNDAEDSAAAAKESEDNVATNANQIANDAASAVIDGVAGQVAVAENAADRAESARDATFANADVYPDVATGLSETSPGDQFQVAEGKNLVRYRNQAGAATKLVELLAEGVIDTNRRISGNPQLNTFRAGEITGPFNHASGVIYSTPGWFIDTAGSLVFDNTLNSTVVRFWDVGSVWLGTEPLEVVVESEWSELLFNTGAYAHLGDLGGPAVRFLYARNGALGIYENNGIAIAGQGGAAVYPEIAFSEGERVTLRVNINPDGSGTITGTNASGVSASHPVFNVIARGTVGPALGRASAGKITKFFARSVDPRVLAVGPIEQSIAELDQRVNELSEDTPATAPMKPLPSPLVAAGFNHLLLYGQSNSIGADAVPPISTSQPYSNVTFHGGVAAWDGSAFDYAPYIPLVEAPDINGGPGGAGVPLGETPCSGAANYATTLRAIDGHDPSEHVILASTAGRGSYQIDQLEKGTPWYANTLLPMIQAAVDVDPDYACHVMCWVQGERDANRGTTYSDYRSRLEALQSDVETDIASISGQAGPTYMLIGQVVAHARQNDGPARAMMDASASNSKIFLVYPSYRIPYDTNIHYSNVGAKMAGAYFGRAYKQMLDGFEPSALTPISATAVGSIIRVRFDVPHPPMRLDTVQLADTADYGFQVRDEQGICDIQTVEVQGPDVVITLVSEPQGASVARYALDYAGSGRSVSVGQEGCGNLRDSAPEKVTIDSAEYQLFNAAPAFELPVVRLGF